MSLGGDNDPCEIKAFVNNAMVCRHPIINIELANMDSNYRQGSRIKIDFGVSDFSKKNCSEDSQYYLNSNLDGTLDLLIDAEFMLSVLINRKTVEELWISEGQEEIYTSLKEIIAKGQEIIELKLIESLKAGNMPLVSFTFGAAIKTLIREDRLVPAGRGDTCRYRCRRTLRAACIDNWQVLA